MSKRSLFWGNASGKLGEAVYYRAKGEQRTRMYVPKIKNPNTLAQVMQRIKMSAVVSAYRQLRGLCSYSFPTKKSNQTDFNRFSSINIKANDMVNFKEAYLDGYATPMGYAVSDGDIPINTDMQISSFPSNPLDNTSADAYAYQPASLLPGEQLLTELEVSNISDPVTGAEVYKMLVGSNNPNNLPLLFNVVIIRSAYADEGYKLEYKYIECSPTSTDVWHVVGQWSEYNFPTLGYATFTETGEGNAKRYIPSSVYVGPTADTEATVGEDGYAIVIGWTENGTQRVTSSRIAYDATNHLAEQFQPGGQFYDEAIASWNPTVGSIIATK